MSRASLPDLGNIKAYASVVLTSSISCPVVPELPPGPGERKAQFLREFGPKYGLNGQLEKLRTSEFRRLGDMVYLDQAGTGLYQESQIQEMTAALMGNVFGNPHSISSCSSHTQELVEKARAAVLDFFGTDDDDHDIVFTCNATAGIKLVGESFPWGPGSIFMHTTGNHTSILGLRQYATARGAKVIAVNDDELAQVLLDPAAFLEKNASSSCRAEAPPPCLFAFPAEDNFHGQLYPLQLASHVKAALGSHWFVLVDAACYAATTPLDVSRFPADFVAVSFAKMLGFPQVGGLLVRRPAGYSLSRPYFGGGTVVECAAGSAWQLWREFPARLEDGTVPFLSLVALTPSLSRIQSLGMANIKAHTTALACWLAGALASLRHSLGTPVCLLHGQHFTYQELQGPMVTFNVLRLDGSHVRLTEIAAHLNDARIQVRAGSLCNAGSCHQSLGIAEDLVVQREFMHGCGWDDLVDGKPLGAVRASVGYFNTWEDVDCLYRVIRDRFKV